MKLNELCRNCVVVTDELATTLYSYNVAVVQVKNNITYLDEKYWNYSKTTSKHRGLFLNETLKETRLKIEKKEYVLTNLN